MFPCDGEVLVAPRHVHVAGLDVSAVLPHACDVDGEASAHRLGDGLLDLLLRVARLCPVTLDELLPVLDFDERAAGVVAGAPECHELLSRFGGPFRRGEELGNLERELRCGRFQNLHRQLRRDLFTEAILRLDDDAIRAGGEVEGGLELTRLVAGETFGGDNFSQFP